MWFDPRPVVRIVNTLHPLGKTKALAAIQEYARIKPPFPSGPWRGIHLILRALFEVPKSGHFPAMPVGEPFPGMDGNPNLVPRFPLIIVDDIPLTLVQGYLVAGGAGLPPDFAFFRDSCKWRQRPLLPTSRPFSVLEKIIASDWWVEPIDSQSIKTGLILQLCRLTSTVYQPRVSKHADSLADILNETKSLDIHWNPVANCYVFRDGSTLTTKKPASRK
jgi:hypothetical protein